jgi:glucose/arabinose dehydrogenase
VLLLALAAGRAGAQPPAELRLEPVVGGLAAPTAIAHAGDERLFVTLLDGRVVVVRDGKVLPQPFLDLTPRVLAGGEQGLLSVAFHPRYRENGWFFVHYTTWGRISVISRFQVSADPDRADGGSERELLRIRQPYSNHNGGQLAFAPDGRLWIAMGDGGGSYDPRCNAQDRTSLLGKLLRIDVDARPDEPPFYAVPPDNPFVAAPAGTARPEVWALGLRNPWRFSFDRATGDLYVADVGQALVEEIDFAAAAAGGGAGANYGWKVMEGDGCTGRSEGCRVPLPWCGQASLVGPVLSYGHDEGCSVTGGYVYRGRRIGGLAGVYLFGDYCSGRVWGAWRDAGGAWRRRELPFRAPFLSTFGEGHDGEVFLAAGSTLYRLTGPPPQEEACDPGADTLCLGADGRFAVRASFRVDGGPPRQAQGRALTSDTGAFWFFSEDNLEVLVKVLDACAAFDRFWVFAAGLTNLELELVVRDTATAAEQRYPNPPGRPFAPVQDTAAFLTCGDGGGS